MLICPLTRSECSPVGCAWGVYDQSKGKAECVLVALSRNLLVRGNRDNKPDGSK